MQSHFNTVKALMESIYCSMCPEEFPVNRKARLVAHMQQDHRIDNEVSDSSDSELDQAEPIQVSTSLRRLEGTTKKANQLFGIKYQDLDNSQLSQTSPQDPPKSQQPSPENSPDPQDHPGLNRPPCTAPSDRAQRITKTSADFESLSCEHGVWRRQATAANTGSDENDQGTTALMTSSTPTKKRRRSLDDVCSSAFDNLPKRLRTDGYL